MSSSDEINMLAAEYVVGTLTSSEREAVEARRVTDTELSSAIAAWEARLSPWLAEYQSVEPPAHVKASLIERVERIQQGESVLPVESLRLRRSVNFWRATALSGYAIAAGLAALVVFREPPMSAPDSHYVAVFQNNDEQPAFVMSIDLKSRQIIVRPVTAKPASGKTYQLWIASDQLGGKPRSLGLLDEPTKPTRKTLPYDADLLQSATFGISLEPEGGSPTGTPTGRAVHGRLIPSQL